MPQCQLRVTDVDPAAALRSRRACGCRDPIADTPYVERGWRAPRGACSGTPSRHEPGAPRRRAVVAAHASCRHVPHPGVRSAATRLAALGKGVTLVDGAAECTRTSRSKRTRSYGPARWAWSAWLSGRAADIESAVCGLGLSRRRHPGSARVPCGGEGCGRPREVVYVCATSALVVSTRQA